MRLIHLTDPHLTDLSHIRLGPLAGKRWLSARAWHRKRQHLHRREQLDALVSQLSPRLPDAFVVTGDLCQVGLNEEIERARDWLDALNTIAPVMLVPGNHDVFARDSVASIERHWSPFFHRANPATEALGQLTLGSIQLIGLNSSLPTAPGLASGRIGHSTLATLRQSLDFHRSRFRIVLLHHPPLRGIATRRKALRDDRQLTEVLSHAGAELVLYGHMHRNLDHALKCANGQSLPLLCTASASSTVPAHPAAARQIDVTEQHTVDGTVAGWQVSVDTLQLDNRQCLSKVEGTAWTTPAAR
ncbi:MAG: metallophosphoesterase [Pseudomonadota bacterium]